MTLMSGRIEKYEAKVKCNNCSFLGLAKIEKGTMVSQAECPMCDCMHVLQRVVT